MDRKIKMEVFSQTTENKLERMFRNLPEIFFWTVISTRLFIMLPLFMSARSNFAFLHYAAIINISALVSVFIVEVILTLPSLSAAFFKLHGMDRYYRIALWSTVIFGLFNQSLICLSWRDIEMGNQAFYVYSVLNVASVVLAEFISFMIKAKRPMTGEKENVPQPGTKEMPQPAQVSSVSPIIIPSATDRLEANGLPSDVNRILQSKQSEPEKAKNLNDIGYLPKDIAPFFGKSERTIYNWISKN